MIQPPNNQITAGTRLGSMIVDHIAMTIVAMVFFIPQMVLGFISAFKISHDSSGPDFFSISYFGLIGFALYICKDCINGRSIAKRLFRLQVVDNKTGIAASPLQCFVRGIFVIMWPIEVLVALANPHRRIGDMVAGTKLVVYDAQAQQPPVNKVKVIAAIALSYGIMLLLTLPIFSLQSKFGSSKVNYVKSSYNSQLSAATEKLFTDSVGQSLKPSIRVYDKIAGRRLKYISVIFYLKQNYLSNDDDFDRIKTKTTGLLISKFPENTFVGRLQYVYQDNSSMQARTITLNSAIK